MGHDGYTAHRAQPQRHLSRRRRRRPRRAQRDLHFGPRAPGDRGGKRLRQIDGRARHHGPCRPPRPYRGGRIAAGRHGLARPFRTRLSQATRPAHRHGAAGPEILARSGDVRRPADRRDAPQPPAQYQARRQARGAGDAAGRAYPRPRAGLHDVSAPGLRRHGPAGDDRHDADRGPRHPDRRRAHVGAGRHRADPGSGHHGRAGAQPRHGPDPDQPQPAPGLLVLRPRAGDVRRPGAGNLRGRKALGGDASLHAWPARSPSPARPPPDGAAAIAARPRLDGRPRMITLDDVTIAYGTGPRAVVAVQNLTLAVPEGEAVGLVGESGSGKSTVLRAVAGLIPYASGEITLAGRRVDRRRTTAQRKMTQMVFQDPYGSLHPNQTVDQILAMPVAIHRLDRGEARIVQALAEVGLGREHRYRYPHQLSGGQRQRVAIARALILEPRILLLDEPTSALDVSVQAEILNLLARLRRDYGLTLLMVSHDLAVIAHLCERIGVMSRGELVEITTATAMANNQVTHDYTRELLRSNAGFDRSSALPLK